MANILPNRVTLTAKISNDYNFFVIGPIPVIFDFSDRAMSLLFIFRTFCAIATDGSRLWDSNQPTGHKTKPNF